MGPFLLSILEKKKIMTLKDIYDKVGEYAIGTQKVEQFKIGNVYTIANSLHITYGLVDVICEYTEVYDNYSVYNMTMYYLGKLHNNSDNIFDEQQNGFDVLTNIIQHLKADFEFDEENSIQIYYFAQDFADVTAGAWCRFRILLPTNNCIDFDK